jgi:tetratricopeptide (TPR) repeat protein
MAYTGLNLLLDQSLKHHQAGRLAQAAEGYESILQHVPNHPDALHLLGVVLQQSGNFELAINLMTAAIAGNSTVPHYYHNLGNTYLQAGKPLEAADSYRQAIRRKPDYHEAYNGLGNALTALNKVDQAIASYQDAIRLKPTFAEAHFNLGKLFSKRNAKREALDHLKTALNLDSNNADYLSILGAECLQCGDFPQAVSYLQDAVRLQPESAEFLCNLGAAFNGNREYQRAEQFLRKAVSIKPTGAAACLYLAINLEVQGRLRECKHFYQQAIELDPKLLDGYLGLGRALMIGEAHAQAENIYCTALSNIPNNPELFRLLAHSLANQEKRSEAEKALKHAIDLNPQFVEAYSDLAVIYTAEKFFDLAEAALRQALKLDPTHLRAIYGLGHLFHLQARPTEAIDYFDLGLRVISSKPTGELSREERGLLSQMAHSLAISYEMNGHYDRALMFYRKALEETPDNPTIHADLGTSLLTCGRFSEGWREIEWRWHMPRFNTKLRDFGSPQWKGEPLNGQKILLHAEQGFGDVIQFARYAALVAERGGEVILEVQPQLVRLLSTIPGVHTVIPQGAPLPDFSWHCPLMSLPLAFETILESIPANIPYITVTDDDLRRAKSRLLDKPVHVGLAWSGNSRFLLNHLRSMHFRHFLPFSEIKDVAFYCLQINKENEQMSEFSVQFPVVDACSNAKDFAESAAFIAGLDLVITVDTATAHLAGALGVPLWILLPQKGDWRWLLNRNDSPWYPNARLFRQFCLGDWEGLIREVKQQLEIFVSQRLSA